MRIGSWPIEALNRGMEDEDVAERRSSGTSSCGWIAAGTSALTTNLSST